MKKKCFKRIMALCAIAALCPFLLLGAETTVIVPGTVNIWLVDRPPDFRFTDPNWQDKTPENSPIQVTGISIVPDTPLTFSASGLVGNDPWGFYPLGAPDGTLNVPWVPWVEPSHNGLSGLSAPIDALIGVFVNNDDPFNAMPPASLDYSTQASRDYLSITPELRQLFFIGDGLTSDGVIQQVIVPEGATRLFLGVFDGGMWNNTGSFTVTITSTPDGGVTIGLLSCAMLGLTTLRRKWQK
jgi:hypothetical protein